MAKPLPNPTPTSILASGATITATFDPTWMGREPKIRDWVDYSYDPENPPPGMEKLTKVDKGKAKATESWYKRQSAPMTSAGTAAAPNLTGMSASGRQTPYGHANRQSWIGEMGWET